MIDGPEHPAASLGDPPHLERSTEGAGGTPAIFQEPESRADSCGGGTPPLVDRSPRPPGAGELSEHRTGGGSCVPRPRCVAVRSFARTWGEMPGGVTAGVYRGHLLETSAALARLEHPGPLGSRAPIGGAGGALTPRPPADTPGGADSE